MNTTETSELFKVFLALCLKHPYFSVPVALILVIGLVAHFFETVKTFVEFVADVHTHGSTLRRRLLWTGLASLVGVAVASPFVALTYLSPRPKPIIRTKGGSLLAEDFHVDWDYRGDEHAVRAYELTVSEIALSRNKYVYTSAAPFYRVPVRGLLGLQVRAISANWHSDYSDEVTVEVYNDSVERIRTTKQLSVAVHPDYSEGLFCFTNAKGQFEGFDIDLVDFIGENLKRAYGLNELNVVKRFATFPEIITQPTAFDVDFAIASISITPERERLVLFSKPYYETELAIVQARPAAHPAALITPEELTGLKIGVHKGTTALAFLENVRASYGKTFEIQVLENNEALFASLANGTITGVAYDYARTLAESASHPNWIARRFDRARLSVQPEQYGISFAQINVRLHDDINRILEDKAAVISGMIESRIFALQHRVATR
jgi:ABC-type amino acid transport substrate-binding protein